MPEYGFIANPQVPNGIQTLGNIVNTARGVQEYQRGSVELNKARETMAADIAQRKAESQRAETEANVSQQTAPNRIAQQAAVTRTAETGATHAQWKMDSEQAQKAYEIAAGTAQDPAVVKGDSAGSVQALMRAEEQMRALKIPEDKIRVQMAPLYAIAGHQPQALRQTLDNIVRGGTPATTQAGIGNAPLTPLSTGSGIQLTQTQPGATGGAGPQGAAIPMTLAPGQNETVIKGPDGNDYILKRAPTGSIVGTAPVSSAGTPTPSAAPGPNVAPAHMPYISPEDAATRPVLEGERNVARNVLGSAPISHQTNRGILDELEKVIATGTTGSFLSKAASIVGAQKIVGGTEAERAASAYDLIGKYTERNALEAAKAMGPGTNAGLEAAIKANGSAAYNPTALKKVTKLNDAIVSGAEAYQPGLEKAIAANPERGVLVKREFDQAWAQNFDPRIMEISNASKTGDKKAVEDILKQVGGRGSAGANELIRKAKAIESLSVNGRLP